MSKRPLGWVNQYARTVEPRYCTCYGDDIPTPDPNGMCPDCLRLVEHLATA